jgi:MFS family permease
MNIGSDIELVPSSPMDRGLPRHLDADDFARLNKRVVRKLDLLLLPFLCLLFLLNSLDKSNVGNAESGHFTEDLGLPKSALNVSVAWFFAVFVTCQPIGAYFGRKYGMANWVPATMSLWGVCTALHIAVQSQTQLVTLRVLIAVLESGFYPTTVSCKSSYQSCYVGSFTNVPLFRSESLVYTLRVRQAFGFLLWSSCARRMLWWPLVVGCV